jgi:hypothetical protein
VAPDVTLRQTFRTSERGRSRGMSASQEHGPATGRGAIDQRTPSKPARRTGHAPWNRQRSNWRRDAPRMAVRRSNGTPGVPIDRGTPVPASFGNCVTHRVGRTSASGWGSRDASAKPGNRVEHPSSRVDAQGLRAARSPTDSRLSPACRPWPPRTARPCPRPSPCRPLSPPVRLRTAVHHLHTVTTVMTE